MVWARNEFSKMPAAREWHWVSFATLQVAGIRWKPKKEKTGRSIVQGYVFLRRTAMTDEEIELAKKHDLFRGKKKTFLREHHLVAVKKYGKIPKGHVVRHMNGIKHDNSFDNIVLGTTQENTMDHNTARLQAIYWRNKYEELLSKTKNN